MKSVGRSVSNLYYAMGILIISFLISSHISGAADFQLLSEAEEGISYVKNPCRPDTFTLTFSFSEDVKDLGAKSLALVAFSKEFQNDQEDIDLFYSDIKRSGDRQFQVDYVARRALSNGEYFEVELPDQIELILLSDDMSKITNMQERSCIIPSEFQKKITLINKNINQKCTK